MTNKVKPFFIRITDDMTPQIALEVKDKCTNKNVSGDFHFNPSDIKRWKYLGVCSQDGLCYSDFTENFYGNAKEITLNQLDEWLGIAGGSPKHVEWKNGDEIEYGNDISMSPCWIGRYVCFDNAKGKHVVENDDDLWHISDSCIRKPETPEQKAEREKKEAIDDIKGAIDFFADSYMSALSLYEQGYRKQ